MWSKRDGGASFEKGEFMTDKSLALNLSRKEALNGLSWSPAAHPKIRRNG